MPDPKPRPAAILSDKLQRAYEHAIADRLPDADTTAFSLFTFALGAGRRAEAFLGDVVRPHGLDGSQFSVLMVLWMQGTPYRLSPTALSRNIAQSPSGMTHTVKRLTAAGLVSRVGLESDGRAKHVELTDDGVDVVTRSAKDLADAVSRLFPRTDLPLEDLAAAQRQIVSVMVQHLP